MQRPRQGSGMNEEPQWDPRYEWKAVLVLSLGFGLVSVDRFMIMPVFPTIMEELQLDFSDLGVITGALAFAWGVAALFIGNLSDRIGHRKVIVGALVMFSVLVGASGLATGLLGLVVVRVLMGFADGAYTPVSVSAVVAVSKPSRHGSNIGLMTALSPLLGLAITPILVTQLLQFIDWRWVFVLLMVPGLLVAAAAYYVLRKDAVSPSRLGGEGSNWRVFWTAWGDVIAYPNPKFLMVGMLCWLTCLIVTTAMMPHYLIDVVRLSVVEMGGVMSAIGFGAAAGCVVMPAISDRIGRKPVMAFSALASATALYAMIHSSEVSGLYLWLFMTHFFNFGLITLTAGTVSVESVPPSLMATSSGMVVAVGEILGGGFVPIAAGYAAERYGLQSVFYIALAAMVVGFFAMLLLKETAPRRRAGGAAAMFGAASS